MAYSTHNISLCGQLLKSTHLKCASSGENGLKSVSALFQTLSKSKFCFTLAILDRSKKSISWIE